MRIVRELLTVVCSLFAFATIVAPQVAQQSLVSSATRTFYVSSFEGSDSNPGTLALPWKTLDKVNQAPLQPGDIVYFARSSSFTGTLMARASGLPGRPITFTQYGTGTLQPRFTNPDYGLNNGNAILITGSYIVIDGLNAHDCAPVPRPRVTERFADVPVARGTVSSLGAIFIAPGAEHNIVRNCLITKAPVGIRISGRQNLITRNWIKKPDRPPAPGWAVIGVAVSAPENEVSHNHILHLGRPGAESELEGAAIELDDPRFSKDSVSILRNFSVGNHRFLEIAGAGVSVKSLVVSYNVSDDYQGFVRLASSEISNAKIENNTVVLARARSATGAYLAAIDASRLGGGATPAMLSYRNNIFYLESGFQVSPHADFPHGHNLFYRTDQATSATMILGAGATLGNGDKIANPVFCDAGQYVRTYPDNFRDLRVRLTSPAIDAGADLGYSKDQDNNPVPTGRAPDIGAYELGRLTTPTELPKAIVEAARPENWKTAPAKPTPGGGAYYVNSITGSDSNLGTITAPWKTLKNVDGHSFAPGDTIYFARGSGFTGGFMISSSGRQGRPITFTAYGSGAAPRFSNPNYSVLNGNAIRVTGSYIVIDDLYFHDCATAPSGTPGGSQKVGAIFITPTAEHNVVRNCEITRSPMCIHVYGQYNLITHNYIHDNTDFETRGWWAVAVMFCHSNNEASYNLIVNCRQPSPQYVADGGAFELDDRVYPKSNIYIHHNRTYGNQGFFETVGGITSVEENIVIAYNIAEDYQWFASPNDCPNLRLENNTIIRYLNNGSLTAMFRIGGDYPSSVRNNIFVIANGPRVFEGRKNGWDYIRHDHNLFFSIDPVPIEEPQGQGVPLNEGEKIADPMFVDFANRDLHLRPGSPAIGGGIPLGFSRDFDNRQVPLDAAPDLGAYQLATEDRVPARSR